MRMITKIADRLLSTVVPEITAGACCSLNGTKYVNLKCVRNGVGARQNCTIDCTCHAICGGWIDYSNSSCR